MGTACVRDITAGPSSSARCAKPVHTTRARRGSLLESYDVCLLVDTREKLSHSERAQTVANLLSSAGVRAQLRPLPVGDFLWVAMPKPEAGAAARVGCAAPGGGAWSAPS